LWGDALAAHLPDGLVVLGATELRDVIEMVALVHGKQRDRAPSKGA
jgi:hypothetical protein